MKYRIVRAAGYEDRYSVECRYPWWPFWLGCLNQWGWFKTIDEAEKAMEKEILKPKRQIVKVYQTGEGWRPHK